MKTLIENHKRDEREEVDWSRRSFDAVHPTRIPKSLSFPFSCLSSLSWFQLPFPK